MLVINNANHQFGDITLNSLMNLCQSNYVNLHKLLNLSFLKLLKNDETLSLLNKHNAVPIHITLLEQAKYTTTFKMSYLFSKNENPIPNIEIRIYYDAKQAEVLKMVHNNRMASFFSLTYHDGLSNIRARFQLNNFLYRWLQYCLENKYEINR